MRIAYFKYGLLFCTSCWTHKLFCSLLFRRLYETPSASSKHVEKYQKISELWNATACQVSQMSQGPFQWLFVIPLKSSLILFIMISASFLLRRCKHGCCLQHLFYGNDCTCQTPVDHAITLKPREPVMHSSRMLLGRFGKYLRCKSQMDCFAAVHAPADASL